MRRCRPALGTYVEIDVRRADDVDAALDAIAAAFEAIERVDQLMSFHRPDSALSRLNAAAAGTVVSLHPWVVQVLRFARELHGLSGGVFEPGVGARLVDQALLPRHPAAGGVSADRSSIASVEVVDDTHVRLREAVCIDLGGIAKGFAVDRAIDVLVERGIAQATVNAGGDLRVLGDAQPVHVRRPDDAARLQLLGELGDGALATSASYRVEGTDGVDGRGEPDGATLGGGPVVDPLSGASRRQARSVSVIASTCMAADALTKILALSGELPPACAMPWDARGIVL